jgi:hypothetical protein
MLKQMMKEMQDNGDHCVGIHELIDWQIIQYRKEVDIHRLDLSQVEKRCVAWQEAEKDFNTADRAVMGKKWRVEYCGSICPSRENCLVAAHFLHNRRDAEPLYRAG